jgi:hypothetical protein
MDKRGLSELTDEELIGEAKALYAWLSSDEAAYTVDDLYRLEKIIEELERRGYTAVETIDFVKEEQEEGAEGE